MRYPYEFIKIFEISIIINIINITSDIFNLVQRPDEISPNAERDYFCWFLYWMKREDFQQHPNGSPTVTTRGNSLSHQLRRRRTAINFHISKRESTNYSPVASSAILSLTWAHPALSRVKVTSGTTHADIQNNWLLTKGPWSSLQWRANLAHYKLTEFGDVESETGTE